jgi:hypothetical protein
MKHFAAAVLVLTSVACAVEKKMQSDPAPSKPMASAELIALLKKGEVQTLSFLHSGNAKAKLRSGPWVPLKTPITDAEGKELGPKALVALAPSGKEPDLMME